MFHIAKICLKRAHFAGLSFNPASCRCAKTIQTRPGSVDVPRMTSSLLNGGICLIGSWTGKVQVMVILRPITLVWPRSESDLEKRHANSRWNNAIFSPYGDLPQHSPPFPTAAPASLAALKVVLGRSLSCSGDCNGTFNLFKGSNLAPLVSIHRP